MIQTDDSHIRSDLQGQSRTSNWLPSSDRLSGQFKGQPPHGSLRPLHTRTAAIAGRLDDRLAAWSGKAVRDAQLWSQLSRGGRVGKVRVTMTVQAADAAKGLVLALDVLRTAIGRDGRSWAVPSAAATVAPVGAAAPAPLARPNLVWRKPLLHRAAILAGAASL
jgi:hypothetical protein